jgi:hypothetical protein
MCVLAPWEGVQTSPYFDARLATSSDIERMEAFTAE